MSDAASGHLSMGVLLGRADDMRAVAYLRLLELPPSLSGSAAQLQLSGTLRGPQCRHASTLPVTAKLTPLAACGEGLGSLPLAEAVLVEPGFWSPELPHRYRLDVQLGSADRERYAWSQMVGLRRLGHCEGSFRLDQRRYVPRAVTVGAPSKRPSSHECLALVKEARQASAAVWSSMPDETLCEAADAEGVMLVAVVDPTVDARAAADAVMRLAIHPSVGFLVIGSEHVAHVASWRSFRGTLQVGLASDGQAGPPACPEGIDFLVAELEPGQLPHEGWRDASGRPVVVRRPWSETAPAALIQQQRRACDRLQADLAAWLAERGTPAWEPAGYGV